MTTLTASEPRSWSFSPSWPWLTGILFTLLGLADAAYLTYVHYTSVLNLACSDKGFVNCAKVTTSTYSHFLGMPVAVLGLAFFAAMLPLQTPWAWASRNPLIRFGRLAMVVIGILMVLWLLYAELVKLDNLCLYCTGVHILTFLLFLTTLFGTIYTSQASVDLDQD